MLLEGKKTSFALTVIASSLLIGCNSSGSDPKLDSTPGKQLPASEISGVALDGYLENAKVCLDLNHNLICDSGDGEVVLTDRQGAYKLPHNGADLSKYNVVVEAIANQTVDMDVPATPVQKGFALSAPAGDAGVVSPLTTLTSIVAAQQGIGFAAARNLLASHLGVDSKRLTSDFLTGNHAEDKQLHALAQGLAVLMQEAEQAAVADGVVLRDARSGSRVKLGLIDVAVLKTETDKLVGTVNQTPEKIREAVKGIVTDVTVTRDEIEGNKVLVQPLAPAQGRLDTAARTFDWQWVGLLTSVEDYEYSIDAGKTWQQVETKPVHLGTKAYAAGDIQVRVKAYQNKGMKAGKVLVSEQPLAMSDVPAAPAAITVNDALNQIDWELVPGYDNFADYEFSTDAGQNWQAAVAKPQFVGDVVIAAGDLKVRVAADDAELRPAGLAAESTSDFTASLAKPEKPTDIQADDTTDSVDWEYVAGFDNYSDYEVSFDNGKSWNEVTAKPLSVGNTEIADGWVQLRVAANPDNGMPAGEIAVVNQSFTMKVEKPAAPANLQVDDSADTIDWDFVAGFGELAHYEISLNGMSTEPTDWAPAGTKPAAVLEGNYAVGEVCLRVKADAADANVAGAAACSDAYFTAKPDMPTAPVVDDDNDTFGWTLVDGYPQLSSYQLKIENSDWQAVDANPYQLEDRAYAKDSIQVRVGPDAVTGRVAGDALTNDIEFTKKAAASDITLLTAAGAVTQDREQAACARMPDGKVWQLFGTDASDERLKTVPESDTELKAFGSSCGLDTWRKPTMAELNSIFSEDPKDNKRKVYDTSVFKYMNVAVDNSDWMNAQEACYVSTDEGYTANDNNCLDISNTEKPTTKVVKADCGGFCMGNLPLTLYRFIAD